MAVFRSTANFNRLFLVPQQSFPENFVKIHMQPFWVMLLTEKKNPWWKQNLIGRSNGNKKNIFALTHNPAVHRRQCPSFQIYAWIHDCKKHAIKVWKCLSAGVSNVFFKHNFVIFNFGSTAKRGRRSWWRRWWGQRKSVTRQRRKEQSTRKHLLYGSLEDLVESSSTNTAQNKYRGKETNPNNSRWVRKYREKFPSWRRHQKGLQEKKRWWSVVTGWRQCTVDINGGVTRSNA